MHIVTYQRFINSILMYSKRVIGMYRYELYNVDEINLIKKELDIHRQTLRAITKGDLLENYVKYKDDVYDLKIKLFELKGEMKAMENEYYEKTLNNEIEVGNLYTQVEEINNSVNHMKQEINNLTYMLTQVMHTELLEKMEGILNKQDTNLIELKKGVEDIKQEMINLKGDSQSKNKRNVKHASEYKRLQQMLQSPNIEQTASQMNLLRQHSYPSTTKRETIQPGIHSNNETISMNKRKKTVRHSQYDLNKNTITKSITPKKDQDEKDEAKFHAPDESLKSYNDTTNFTNEHPLQENNAEENQIRNKEAEDIVKNNVESTELEMENKDNLNRQQSEVNKKSDLTSFFSFFRRS